LYLYKLSGFNIFAFSTTQSFLKLFLYLVIPILKLHRDIYSCYRK